MIPHKRILLLALCLVAAAAFALVAWHLSRSVSSPTEYASDQDFTNQLMIYENGLPHANPQLVGVWRNDQNPGWHKAYYDDYDDEEEFFWGKEWDENDDVFEEDLKYHGNGWFRWKLDKGILHEYATMDYRDVPIHRGYKVTKFTADSLVYFESERKQPILRFGKVTNY